MGWLFKDREDAITCNSDAAADAWRKAAKAKKAGDQKAAKAWTDWARDCDQTATRFANGDYDDVIQNP
ncbi:hypothetical protein ACIBQX_10435 [Nonomuraea sp. NPDC049714]|jgi:hypothetical protein|uniref:hypothetical protein n=1 Tax=Nonomuraea sp. NPDC049714 TaxID=3364357 RepID=UPI0037B6E1CF